MRTPGTPKDTSPDLTPLAPGATVPEAVRRRFEDQWQALTDLGFSLEVRADSLVVRHPERGFEATIELTRPDDLGERRELYRALRRAFGGRLERWLPQLVQASQPVTRPYQSLKNQVEVCQALRRSDVG